jgi:replicative DNA helicase
MSTILPSRLYNPEIEDTIIGTCLFEPELIEIVLSEGIKETDFSDELNRKIFQTIIKLWIEKGNVLTFDLILEELKKERIIPDLIQEEKLIQRYAGNSIRSRDILVEYCRLLKDYYLKRELFNLAQEILNANHLKGEELLERVLEKAFKLSEQRETMPYVSIAEVLPIVKEKIERFSLAETYITGLPTGFPDLDRLTTGFHGGEFIIIAGRPGMGKTSFGLTIAKNVALDEGKPVGIFSLEMSRDQLVQRLISFVSHIPLHDLRLGKITEEQKEIFMEAIRILSSAPIFINDASSLTTTDLRLNAKRMKKEQDIALIIVDYLQLVKGVGRYSSRQEEVAEVSRSLKALAKELDIPVIALAQLSRQVEQRGDKRPVLADLRESGSIEQDADIVMFLYRPEYYMKLKKKEIPPDQKGKVEIIVAKHRQGPTGVVLARFVEKLSLFTPYTEEDFTTPPEEEDLFDIEDFEEDEGLDFKDFE